MIQILRLASFGSLTGYTFSANYEGGYVCSRCLKQRNIIKNQGMTHSNFKPGVTPKIVTVKKTGIIKKRVKKAELLNVTDNKTTQTTMPIGKLNASSVTAFAEEPGMILTKVDCIKANKKGKKLKLISQNHKTSHANGLIENSSTVKDLNVTKNNSQGVKNAESNNFIMKNMPSNKQLQTIKTMSKSNVYYDSKKIFDKALMDQSETNLEQLKDKTCKNIKSVDKTAFQSNFFMGNGSPASKQCTDPKRINQLINSAQLDEEAFQDYDNTESTRKEANPDLFTKFSWKGSAVQRGENTFLQTYLDICVNTGLLDRALAQLKIRQNEEMTLQSPDIYNIVLHAFSKKSDWNNVNYIMKLMETKKVVYNARTYAIYLDAVSRGLVPEKYVIYEVNEVLDQLSNLGYKLGDLFEESNLLSVEERDNILRLVRLVEPNFEIAPQRINLNSTCSLVSDLYTGTNNLKSQVPDMGYEEMYKLVEEQLKLEEKLVLPVKTVGQRLNCSPKHKKIWSTLMTTWRRKIEAKLIEHLNVLKAESARELHKPSLYVYLQSIPVKYVVDAMMQEVERLPFSAESYSEQTTHLYIDMGHKIWYRYLMQKKFKDERLKDKIISVVKSYSEWHVYPDEPARSSRHKWQMLLQDIPEGRVLEEEEEVWPISVRKAIGKFVYNIIFNTVLLEPNVLCMKSIVKPIPVFFLILRFRNGTMREEVKCHSLATKLFKRANVDVTMFNVDQLPMRCPPKPWTCVSSGGYYILPTAFVREKDNNINMKLLRSVPNKDLYAIFDSLNQLQSIAWTINEEVLDIAIEVFNNGGDKDLSVPPYPEKKPTIQIPPDKLSPERKYQLYKEKMKENQQRQDEYGLWCDAVYKLSLANHFRKEVFWLPQNMDFRGRVYPVPPHMNHITADLYRSLLIFHKKEPLGERGLDWLKLQAINLAETHKKEPLGVRLAYANEILSDIIDSADNPLTGRRWWTKSESPWQTLAVCIELRNAYRCANPASYLTGIPIHQDGSCNGLQHYAALGKDSFGSASVNLKPSDLPQDVYSVVTGLVEEERQKDEANGMEIAVILKGFVSRKVVKRTVMTTVYGVTPYGAKLQIADVLKDIKGFPQDRVSYASHYLSLKIFSAFQKMFTSAKEIQDWFLKCSDAITGSFNECVTWVSPLGLPVIQPYFSKMTSKDGQRISPNRMKQRNAFPPNFIHSLDSCHMMLTALYCGRAGLTFASVHDCFWTHPCNVDLMNKICREKFIAIHSQKILDDLSNHFVSQYPAKCSKTAEVQPVFREVPQIGDFDINTVADSVYFFS